MVKLNLAHYFELRSAMSSITSSLASIWVICEMRNAKMQDCNTASAILHRKTSNKRRVY